MRYGALPFPKLLGAGVIVLLFFESGCGARTGLPVPSDSSRSSGSSGSSSSSGSCGLSTPASLPCSGNVALGVASRPATGFSPTWVTAGDLTGDGKADLVVVDTLGNDAQAFTLSFLLGKGDGTFFPQIAQDFTPPGGDKPESAALADLNGDGHLDLVVASTFVVSVLFGKGDGTFGDEADYPLAKGFQAALEYEEVGPGNTVALADLNGDGHVDLAVANNNLQTDAVSVRLNNGDGSFGPESLYPTGKLPMSLVAADLNGDCRPDLVVADDDFTLDGTQEFSVSVLLNQGDGTFAPQARQVVGTYPDAVAALDLDGDGKPDLVAVNGGDDSVSVLLGKGDGTFLPKVDYPTGPGPGPIAAVDLDGDGKPDVVTANADATVSVLLGRGDGTLAAPVAVPTGSMALPPLVLSLLAADLNGDGRSDLAMTNGADDTVSVLLDACAK